MKANQAFKANEDAVSPVIGVILMVAITVVLAAVVFVLVGNLTDTSDSAPQVVFTKSGSGNNTVLTVQSTSEAVTWDAFSPSFSSDNCELAGTTIWDGDENELHFNGSSVTAGNTLRFQGDGGTNNGCIGVTFNLVHTATNQIAGRATL